MRRWIPAVFVLFLATACGREGSFVAPESPAPIPTATAPAVETAAPTPSPSPAATTAAAPPPRAASASGINGRVVHGPVCSPGETNCEGRPIHGVDVKAHQGDRIVRGTYTDEEGKFTIPLAPGTYLVTVSTRSFPRCDQKMVDVLPGYYTPVHLTCDAGEPGT